MGHTEGASGVAAVTKSCLIFQKNWIPPNIRFKTPNPKIEGLKNGSLKPVEVNTRFEDNLIALNCFGFGGSNAHVILERNFKKNNESSNRITNSPSFPRLINLCSRNKKGIDAIINFFRANPTQVTKDFLALLNEYSRMDPLKMTIRCSLIMNEDRQIEWNKLNDLKGSRRLVLFFPDVSSAMFQKTITINPDLLEIKPFYESIKENMEYLTKTYMITTMDTFQSALIYQMALTDLVKFLEITPQQTTCKGSGSMIKDYFDGNLSRKQVLDAIVNHNIPPEEHSDSLKLSEEEFIYEISPFSSDGICSSLLSSNSELKDFLKSLGTIYSNGCRVRIEKLYPKVEWPVSQETASLSPLVKWNHEKIYLLTRPEYFNVGIFRMEYLIDLVNPTYKFLAGHVIDGRILFPATGYLWLVREFFLRLKFKVMHADHGVELKNIRLSRATILNHNNSVILNIFIDKSTGKFCVAEGGSECVSGSINLLDSSEESTKEVENIIRRKSLESEDVVLSQTDVYKELRICGYDYSGSFQGIQSARMDGTHGTVKWTGHWISFADCVAQISALRSDRQLIIPTSIDYLKIDLKSLTKEIEKNPSQKFEISFDYEAQVGCCKGLIVKGLKGSAIPRKFPNVWAEEYIFVPFEEVIQREEQETKKLERYSNHCTIMANVVAGSQPWTKELSEEMQKEIESNLNHSLLKILMNYYESQLKTAFDILVLADDYCMKIYETDDRMIRNVVRVVVENLPIYETF